jgi:hypothetical protein
VEFELDSNIASESSRQLESKQVRASRVHVGRYADGRCQRRSASMRCVQPKYGPLGTMSVRPWLGLAGTGGSKREPNVSLIVLSHIGIQAIKSRTDGR